MMDSQMDGVMRVPNHVLKCTQWHILSISIYENCVVSSIHEVVNTVHLTGHIKHVMHNIELFLC